MNDDQSDDELLAQLAAIVDADVDDVPDDLSAFARSAQSWSVLDEELAELVDAEASTVRSTGLAASAIFDLAEHEIVVAMRGDVLVGEITPAAQGLTVEVQTLEGRQPVEVDELGRFRATDVELPFRVRLDSPALTRPAMTPWVTH